MWQSAEFWCEDGRLIGGMVDQAQLQSKEDISQWISVLSVSDIDAAAALLAAAGGSVLTSQIRQ